MKGPIFVMMMGFLLVIGVAHSQEPKNKESQKAVPQQQRGTEKKPQFVTSIPRQKTQNETQGKDKERVEMARERAELSVIRREARDAMVIIAKESETNTKLTVVLCIIAGFQALFFVWQLGLMSSATEISRNAATAARDSADSAVRATMPVLFPHVDERRYFLHPLSPSAHPITYEARLLIAFDNYGKTPAIIREFKAALYLTQIDSLPKYKEDDFVSFPYSVMVPGDFKGKDLTTGALDFRQNITLTRLELEEVLAEGIPSNNYRRFALMGKVIYDDFFGSRHTRRFCLKFRAMVEMRTALSVTKHHKGMKFYKTVTTANTGLFQIGHGGSEYTRTTTEKIPENDRLA